MRSFFQKLLICSVFVSILPVYAYASDNPEAASAESIEVSPLGVKPIVREGLFADLQTGVFFSMNIDSGRVSNAQPFIGLALGYDLTRNLNAGLGLAHASSAGICFQEDATGLCRGARSFSVILLNAHFGFLHGFTHQWYLGLKALGGAALMTPEPVVVSGSAILSGFNGGIALSTEYHTHLEHLVLGLDIAGTFIMGGNHLQFAGIAVYPRLKYVF